MSAADRTTDEDVLQLLETQATQEDAFTWIEDRPGLEQRVSKTTKLAVRKTTDPNFAHYPWLILVVRR